MSEGVIMNEKEIKAVKELGRIMNITSKIKELEAELAYLQKKRNSAEQGLLNALNGDVPAFIFLNGDLWQVEYNQERENMGWGGIRWSVVNTIG